MKVLQSSVRSEEYFIKHFTNSNKEKNFQGNFSHFFAHGLGKGATHVNQVKPPSNSKMCKKKLSRNQNSQNTPPPLPRPRACRQSPMKTLQCRLISSHTSPQSIPNTYRTTVIHPSLVCYSSLRWLPFFPLTCGGKWENDVDVVYHV